MLIGLRTNEAETMLARRSVDLLRQDWRSDVAASKDIVGVGARLMKFRDEAAADIFPRLVWPNDEVDVVVTFTAERLPAIQGEDMQAVLGEAQRELWSGPIAEIESQLSRLGVGFDKGMGPEGRDWEWDWSLCGPISVRFRRRTKKPMRRTGFKQATGRDR